MTMNERSLAKFVLVALIFLVVTNAHAKRVAPAKLAVLKRGGVEFKAVDDMIACEPVVSPHEEACGYVESIAAFSKTNKLIWKTEIYRRMYNRELEIDVQMIAPKSWALNRKGREIQLFDEQDNRYVIDSKSGKRIAPRDPVNYPPGLL
jgi:hypothetical protein